MPRAAPSPVIALRRSVLMRTFSGPRSQPIYLTIALFSGAGAVIATVDPRPGAQPIIATVLSLVAAALWLVGATAWVRFDDVGVHSRCYLRRNYRWDDITAVGIRRDPGGYGSGQRHLKVLVGDRWRVLVPATGRWRRNREFVGRVAAAATERHIAVDVTDL